MRPEQKPFFDDKFSILYLHEKFLSHYIKSIYSFILQMQSEIKWKFNEVVTKN